MRVDGAVWLREYPMDAEEWREERERQTAAPPSTPPEPIEAPLRKALHLESAQRMSAMRGFALISGKRVLAIASETGASAEEIDAMKRRMNQWVSYLAEYERDVESVKRNDALSKAQKREVLEGMERARTERRRELFG